ncbi:MAG: hypothetical protein ABR936_17215 [Bacteroidota bacterium]
MNTKIIENALCYSCEGKVCLKNKLIRDAGIGIKMPLKNRGEAKAYRIIFVVVSFQE